MPERKIDAISIGIGVDIGGLRESLSQASGEIGNWRPPRRTVEVFIVPKWSGQLLRTSGKFQKDVDEAVTNFQNAIAKFQKTQAGRTHLEFGAVFVPVETSIQKLLAESQGIVDQLGKSGQALAIPVTPDIKSAQALHETLQTMVTAQGPVKVPVKFVGKWPPDGTPMGGEDEGPAPKRKRGKGKGGGGGAAATPVVEKDEEAGTVSAAVPVARTTRRRGRRAAAPVPGAIVSEPEAGAKGAGPTTAKPKVTVLPDSDVGATGAAAAFAAELTPEALHTKALAKKYQDLENSGVIFGVPPGREMAWQLAKKQGKPFREATIAGIRPGSRYALDPEALRTEVTDILEGRRAGRRVGLDRPLSPGRRWREPGQSGRALALGEVDQPPQSIRELVQLAENLSERIFNERDYATANPAFDVSKDVSPEMREQFETAAAMLSPYQAVLNEMQAKGTNLSEQDIADISALLKGDPSKIKVTNPKTGRRVKFRNFPISFGTGENAPTARAGDVLEAFFGKIPSLSEGVDMFRTRQVQAPDERGVMRTVQPSQFFGSVSGKKGLTWTDPDTGKDRERVSPAALAMIGGWRSMIGSREEEGGGVRSILRDYERDQEAKQRRAQRSREIGWYRKLADIPDEQQRLAKLREFVPDIVPKDDAAALHFLRNRMRIQREGGWAPNPRIRKMQLGGGHGDPRMRIQRALPNSVLRYLAHPEIAEDMAGAAEKFASMFPYTASKIGVIDSSANMPLVPGNRILGRAESWFGNKTINDRATEWGVPRLRDLSLWVPPGFDRLGIGDVSDPTTDITLNQKAFTSPSAFRELAQLWENEAESPEGSARYPGGYTLAHELMHGADAAHWMIGRRFIAQTKSPIFPGKWLSNSSYGTVSPQEGFAELGAAKVLGLPELSVNAQASDFLDALSEVDKARMKGGPRMDPFSLGDFFGKRRQLGGKTGDPQYDPGDDRNFLYPYEYPFDDDEPVLSRRRFRRKPIKPAHPLSQESRAAANQYRAQINRIENIIGEDPEFQGYPLTDPSAAIHQRKIRRGIGDLMGLDPFAHDAGGGDPESWAAGERWADLAEEHRDLSVTGEKSYDPTDLLSGARRILGRARRAEITNPPIPAPVEPNMYTRQGLVNDIAKHGPHARGFSRGIEALTLQDEARRLYPDAGWPANEQLSAINAGMELDFIDNTMDLAEVLGLPALGTSDAPFQSWSRNQLGGRTRAGGGGIERIARKTKKELLREERLFEDRERLINAIENEPVTPRGVDVDLIGPHAATTTSDRFGERSGSRRQQAWRNVYHEDQQVGSYRINRDFVGRPLDLPEREDVLAPPVMGMSGLTDLTDPWSNALWNRDNWNRNDDIEEMLGQYLGLSTKRSVRPHMLGGNTRALGGGIERIGVGGQHLWDAPGPGWIIPHHLVDKMPVRKDGGRTPKNRYLVGEAGDELFVPEALGGLIPPKVMAQLPKREDGGGVGPREPMAHPMSIAERKYLGVVGPELPDEAPLRAQQAHEMSSAERLIRQMVTNVPSAPFNPIQQAHQMPPAWRMRPEYEQYGPPLPPRMQAREIPNFQMQLPMIEMGPKPLTMARPIARAPEPVAAPEAPAAAPTPPVAPATAATPAAAPAAPAAPAAAVIEPTAAAAAGTVVTKPAATEEPLAPGLTQGPFTFNRGRKPREIDDPIFSKGRVSGGDIQRVFVTNWPPPLSGRGAPMQREKQIADLHAQAFSKIAPAGPTMAAEPLEVARAEFVGGTATGATPVARAAGVAGLAAGSGRSMKTAKGLPEPEEEKATPVPEVPKGTLAERMLRKIDIMGRFAIEDALPGVAARITAGQGMAASRALSTAGGELSMYTIGGRRQIVERARGAAAVKGLAGEVRGMRRGLEFQQADVGADIAAMMEANRAEPGKYPEESIKERQKEFDDLGDAIAKVGEQEDIFTRKADEMAKGIAPLGAILRGTLTNTIGIVGGMTLFTAAMQAFQTAMVAVEIAAKPMIDRMTGFGEITNKTIAPLAEQERQLNGNTRAVIAAAAAHAGLGDKMTDQMQIALKSRIENEAGSKAFIEQAQLVQTSLGVNQQGILQPSGGIPGLTRSTGGLLGSPAFATPSIQETLNAALLQGAPQSLLFAGKPVFGPPTTGGPSSPEGIQNQIMDWSISSFAPSLQAAIREGMPAVEVPPLETKVTDEFVKTVDAFNEDVSKTEIPLKMMRVEGLANAEALKQASKAAMIAAGESEGMAENYVKAGYAVVDMSKGVAEAVGRGGYAQYLGAGAQGALTATPSQIMAMNQRAMDATIRDIDRRSKVAVEVQQPAAYALRRIAEPLIPYAEDPRARGATKQLLKGPKSGSEKGMLDKAFDKDQTKANKFFKDYEADAVGAQTAINAQLEKGKKLLESMGIPQETIDRLGVVGSRIAEINKDLTQKQTNLSVAEYTNQIRLATRSLKDARDMWAGIKGAIGSSYGMLEGMNIRMSRQLQLLGFELQQRQINFQLATAGFVAPGTTPEERAARIEAAKIEADYAQRQLDLQKKIAANQYQQTGIGAQRSITDLQAQTQLLVQGRALVQETNAAQAAIEKLSEERQILLEQASTFLGGAIAKENVFLDIWKSIEEQTGEVLNGEMEALAGAWKAAHSDYENKFLIPTMNSINRIFKALGIATMSLGKAGNPYTGPYDSETHAAGTLFNTTGRTQITVGEAGTETVAVLRNPRQILAEGLSMAGSGSDGGSGPIQIIFNNPVVKEEGDIDAIVRRVEAVLMRKTTMFGLRRV